MEMVYFFLLLGFWLAVPLVGYHVFALGRHAHELTSLPRITSFALRTTAGIVVWSVLLLASALLGVYRAEYFGVAGWLVVLLSLVKVVRQRKFWTSMEWRLSPWDGVLWVGLTLAAVLYLGFPTESILGGRDQGVYANHGIYIARHGRLDVPYPWQAESEEEKIHVLESHYLTGLENIHAARALSSSPVPVWFTKALKSFKFHSHCYFPGLYKTYFTMTVQFSHLLPVWLAQTFTSFGYQGMFRLNGVFALLVLSVFYGLCLSIVPAPYAVVATLMLALNPGQIWLARITLSEILTQLFTCSGLFLLLWASKNGSEKISGWAGVFLGFSSWVRIDSLLLVPLLFLSHMVMRVLDEHSTKRASHVWAAFYQTALPVLAVGIGYYAFFSTPYFYALSRNIMLIGLAGLISFLLLMISLSGALARIRPWVTNKGVIAAVGFICFSVTAYAYWIRPGMEPYAKFWWPGTHLHGTRNYIEDSLVNLARYLSPFIVWTGIWGWFLSLYYFLRNKKDLHLTGALVVIGGFSVLYLHNSSISPDHFWAIRRFIPVIIPGFIFFAALGTWWLLCKFSKYSSLVLSLLIIVYFCIFIIRADALICAFSENKGYFDQLRKFADKLPENEYIFTHGSPIWTTPLYMAFDRKLLPLDLNSSQNIRFMKEWLDQQKNQLKPIYLLYEGRLSMRGAEKLDSVSLTRSYSEPTVHPLPKKILDEQIEVGFYKIMPSTTTIKDHIGILLGAQPLWGVEESGFWGQEWGGDRPFRWTNGTAKLVVPLNKEHPPKLLKIDLSSTGPSGTRLRVLFNGCELFNQFIPAGEWKQTLSLVNCSTDDQGIIELLSDTFVPQKTEEGLQDSRALGVAVRTVRLLEKDNPLSREPLSDKGYVSRLNWIGEIKSPSSLPKSSEITVQNMGEDIWLSLSDLERDQGSIRVGILWFASGQTDKRLAEHRAELPYSLFPGDQVEIKIALNPLDYEGKPLPPGSYEVRIGLVQEGVTWFYERGDKVLRVPVIIGNIEKK